MSRYVAGWVRLLRRMLVGIRNLVGLQNKKPGETPVARDARLPLEINADR
jgi:hypothetical protein